MSDSQKLRFTKGIINLIFSSIFFIALVCFIWLMFTCNYAFAIPAIGCLIIFFFFTPISIEYFVASGSKKIDPQPIHFYSDTGALKYLYGKIYLVVSYVILGTVISFFWLIFIMDDVQFLVPTIFLLGAFILLISNSVSYFYDAGEYVKERFTETP